MAIEKTLVKISALALIAASVLASCGDAGVIASGSLRIDISDAVSRTILPSLDMDPASYELSGAGPAGASFVLVSASENVTIADLAFGAWTVSVTALNAGGIAIGSGSGSISIHSSQTSSLVITVSPLAGNGSLSLALTWPAADVEVPVVSSSILPVSGPLIPVPFIMGAGAANASIASIPAGYYALTLVLLDGSVPVMGAVEVLRIASGETSSASFAFARVNGQDGGLQIGITPDMGDPIPVSITGSAATKSAADTLSMGAIVAAGTGNVVYAWYVNGVAASTGEAFDFGPGYAAGFYRIDLTVFTVDGKRAGSAGFDLEVL